MTDPTKDEITRALVRSLSSASAEIGEFIADKIRFLRWRVAIRTMERAKAILDEKGIQTKRPSLKFLVPFLEECSLEEEVEIENAWANILASASENERAEHVVFIGLLSRLKAAHLRYLDFLCGRGVSTPLRDDIDLEAVPTEFSPWIVRKVIGSERAPQNYGDVDHFVDSLEDLFNARGVALSYARLTGKYDEHRDLDRLIEQPRTGHLDHDASTIFALQALGVITIREVFDVFAGISLLMLRTSILLSLESIFTFAVEDWRTSDARRLTVRASLSIATLRYVRL